MNRHNFKFTTLNSDGKYMMSKTKLYLFCILCSVILIGSGLQTNHAQVSQNQLPYSFSSEPFIHPKIVKDLSTWMSDRGDQVVSINLLDSQDSNRYYGNKHILETDGEHPFVFTKKGSTSFGYEYVGTTNSGITILLTSDYGGGSGQFMGLLFLTLSNDQGISCDWEESVIRFDRDRLLITKLGSVWLGDRWSGELRVDGNELFVGKDNGWFSTSGGTGGGHLSYDRRDRVLKIESVPTKKIN